MPFGDRHIDGHPIASKEIILKTHTAGEWSLKTAANGDIGISAEGTGIFIEVFADIRHSGEDAREEAQANAKLVRSAPELLAALKDCVDRITTAFPDATSFGPIQKARQVIAKAELRIWQVDDRVQDAAGFTGTITARWRDEVEVTWDVSGCCSDLKADQVFPMIQGQDAEEIQTRLQKQIGKS
jgi:hypothetical protein